MDGDAALQSMIDRLQSVGGLAERVAPELVPIVRAEIERTIAAGQSPDGKAWKPRKSDGRAPLRRAAKNLLVSDVGGTIYVRLIGVEALHHSGEARGGTVRQVIPEDDAVPAPMADAIREHLDRVFAREFGGGNGG